jgi:hypothetical protein
MRFRATTDAGDVPARRSQNATGRNLQGLVPKKDALGVSIRPT